MIHSFKKTLTSFFLVGLTTALYGKPRLVSLDKELKEAVLIEYVEVINYTDSTIVFNILDSNKVCTAKTRGAVVQGQLFDKHTTGNWPLIGEKVLIVVGQGGGVSLFANKQSEHYRFWSPAFTGSTAMFHFKKPAIKLPNGKGLSTDQGDYETCWDGCLLPIDQLASYGRE